MILCLNDFSFDVSGVLKYLTIVIVGFPGGSSGKEPACQCRRRKRCGFDPWVAKIPWTKKWNPTPVFLPGESYGQRNLMGYSPWGHRDSDMIKHTSSSIIIILLVISPFMSINICFMYLIASVSVTYVLIN